MNQPQPERLLALAHLVRPHGLRGEISSIGLAPPVLDLGELLDQREVVARSEAGEVLGVMQVESLRPHQDRWLIKLVGIEDPEQADTLRGVDLCVPRAQLPELPEGWYYEDDLEGCRVVDRRLGELGTVTGLETNRAQPQLLVRRPEGALISIPWVRAFISAVDLERREIGTDLPIDFPGLEEHSTQD